MLVALAGAICRPGGASTPQASDPVLIGAGDIADGFNLNLASSTATAVLLDANPAATVFAAGDLAYDNGSDGDFAKSYDPTWGRARARTIPVVGNHEYNTLNAAGFFSYFGPAAGDPTKGYYSLNIGAWHIVLAPLCRRCGTDGRLLAITHAAMLGPRVRRGAGA